MNLKVFYLFAFILAIIGGVLLFNFFSGITGFSVIEHEDSSSDSFYGVIGVLAMVGAGLLIFILNHLRKIQT